MPRLETLRSHNMMLRVAAPLGPTWTRMEAAAKDGLLAGIKCVSGSPPKALALDAKLFVVTAAMPATVEALSARDWRAHYLGGMFAEVTTLNEARRQHYGAAGFAVEALELTVEGQLRQPPQALRMVERYAPFGDKLLVISALGAPEQHHRHALLINSWMGHCTVEE